MIKSIVVAFVFLVLTRSFVQANYCSISTCKWKPHTACIYQSPYPRCQNVLAVGLSAYEKTRILNLHNELRMRVASGQEWRGTHGPQPPAINMQYMEWDYELEYIAQTWAQQCNYGHDSCRDVGRFQVGQNVQRRGTTENVYTITVDDIVLAWFDEVKDFNRNDVYRFRSITSANGKVVGHYVQMVWADTNKIGCGAMRYTEGRFNRFYVVCNYGPSGNRPGQPIYRTY